MLKHCFIILVTQNRGEIDLDPSSFNMCAIWYIWLLRHKIESIKFKCPEGIKHFNSISTRKWWLVPFDEDTTQLCCKKWNIQSGIEMGSFSQLTNICNTRNSYVGFWERKALLPTYEHCKLKFEQTSQYVLLVQECHYCYYSKLCHFDTT